jgi:uncharacterized protein YbaR (Trm112 family)
MEMILDGGRTVVCPECFAHLHVDEPVTEGQELTCHQCRLVVVIERQGEALVPVARPADDAEEDRTW